MNSRSYSAVGLTRSPEDGDGRLRRPGQPAGPSAVGAADGVERVGGQCPGRPGGCFGEGVDSARGESVEVTPLRVGVALLDARRGPDDRLRADGAEVADDRGRLHDGATADVT